MKQTRKTGRLYSYHLRASRQLLHHLKTCTLDVEVHIGQNLHIGERGAPLLGELHGLEDTAVADGRRRRTAAGYVGCE